MSTPAREGETIEGSRTTRNRPYPVLKCSRSNSITSSIVEKLIDACPHTSPCAHEHFLLPLLGRSLFGSSDGGSEEAQKGSLSLSQKGEVSQPHPKRETIQLPDESYYLAYFGGQWQQLRETPFLEAVRVSPYSCSTLALRNSARQLSPAGTFGEQTQT